MKKCVIYARQSSGSDDLSESVDNQILNCKKLAEKEGLEIVGIYQDLNTSGKTYPAGAEAVAESDKAFVRWYNQQTGTKKYRQGLGEVFAKLQIIDCIVVDDMTRLYRPVTRSYLESYCNEQLTANNVTILQVKGGQIDLSKFDQSLIQTLKNAIQDEAIHNQKTKSKQQLKKLKDTGYTVGGKGHMFGYKQVSKQQYCVDESEAKHLQQLFKLAATGMSYAALARSFNGTWMGGRRLATAHVKRLLERPEYIGKAYNSQGELITSRCFEPIIETKLFYDVQNILQNKSRVKAKDKGQTYVFSGLVYCNNCKKSMVIASNAKGAKYYVCQASLSYGTQFDNRIRYRFDGETNKENIKPDTINFIGLYEALMPLNVIPLINQISQTQKASQTENQIAEIKVQIDSINNFEGKLSKMLFDEKIDDNQFEKFIAEKRVEKKELKARLLTLESQMQKVSFDELKTKQHFAVYKAIFGAIKDEAYRANMLDIMDKIVVTTDSITIYFKDGSNFDLPRTAYKRGSTLPKWTIDNPRCDLLNGDTLIIKYYYPGYYSGNHNQTVIYQGEQLQIVAVGV